MKTTISFYLENEHGKTSALWYIDIKNTSDIYIKNNLTIKDLHFSQHQSNEAHDTFTESFMRKNNLDDEDKNLVKIEVENYNDFSKPCLIWSYRTAGEELNAPTYQPHPNSKKIELQNNQVAEIFVLRIPQIYLPDASQCPFGNIIKHKNQEEFICIQCVQHINDTYILVVYRLLDYLDTFRRKFIEYKINPIKKAKANNIMLSGNQMLLIGETKDRYIWGNEMRGKFGHVELYI